MSWLFIDTHAPGAYRLGVYDAERGLRLKSYVGRTRELLRYLQKGWKAEGAAWRGIAVVAGPGSFSSIRIGVLYANLLATCLRLPLVALSVEESSDASTLERVLAVKVKTVSKDRAYIAPIYDAEPNITMPRSS